jgi:hypothetical protein
MLFCSAMSATISLPTGIGETGSSVGVTGASAGETGSGVGVTGAGVRRDWGWRRFDDPPLD